MRPGSSELAELFERRPGLVALGNDTFCGAGFAPLTDLERIVLAVERALNSRKFKVANRETGEDIKIIGCVAAALLDEVPEITEAECYLVSEIGSQIDEPKLAFIRVRGATSDLSRETEKTVRLVAERHIKAIGHLWQDFLTGTSSIA